MKQELMAGVVKNRLELDPRTKLLLLLIMNIVMMGGGIQGTALVIRPLIAFIPCCLLLMESRYRAAFLYFIFFSVAASVEIYSISRTTGLSNLILIIVSALFTRFMPCFTMGYYVVTTTTVSQFIASMERMHISYKIIIPMSVMFRFFPTVLEEFYSISDSMKMRGIGGTAILKEPVKALEYRVVPLMVSVVKIGEELSAAALTRGLGNPEKRTNICRIGIKVQDILLGGIGLAGLICMSVL